MFKASEENTWLSIYVVSSWMCNIGHGMMITVLGPTQPYLAKNVGVNIDAINLVWSFGFSGYVLGALTSGFVFKRFLTHARVKTTYLCLMMGTNGLLMLCLPFLRSFTLLIWIRFVQNALLGAYITADSSMLLYTMGPFKSRPFTNGLHAAVGAGFFATSFLVRPFLPDEATANKDRDELCNMGQDTTTTGEEKDVYTPKMMWGLDSIAWPFIMAGAWCILFSIGYLTLGFLPMKMPRYYETSSELDNDEGQTTTAKMRTTTKEEEGGETKIHYWKTVLVFVFLYYAFSCGIERIFQPMAYTYGICGPLQLSPSAAVVIDSSYNGGFLAGRLVSVVVGWFLRPRNMIIASVLTCVSAATLLVLLGSQGVYWVYFGTALLGFFVSWQFGSCYSWIAQKINLTGRLSPLCFIGCGVGSCIFPPLAGFVFTSPSWGPDGILHLTLIVCVVQCIVYAAMWMLSRRRANAGAVGVATGGN